jgi:hypothetical protein
MSKCCSETSSMRVNSPPPALANRTLTPRPSLGDVALNTGGVGADLLHRRVELGLAAAGDEDVRALVANRCAVARPIPVVSSGARATSAPPCRT